MRVRSTGRFARRALAMGVLLGVASIANAQVVRGPTGAGTRAGHGDSGPSASVPLPFAPERSGLPIPVQVLFVGGGSVGHAGLGWEMPLSYVQIRDDNIGRLPHRNNILSRRVTLAIGGTTVDLVSTDAQGNRWTPRDLSRAGELVNESTSEDARWVYREGSTQYEFRFRPGSTTTVRDAKRFYLTKVSQVDARGQASNSQVKLEYAQNLFSASHEVLLSAVEYNYLPGGESCAKNRVEFLYETALPAGRDGVARVSAPTPSASTGLATASILKSVAFSAKGSCSENNVRDRQIDLIYSEDVLTGMPRLVEVMAKGRAGSGDTALPVRKFKYGSANGAIAFESPGASLASTLIPEGMAPTFNLTTHEELAEESRSSYFEDAGEELADLHSADGIGDGALQKLAGRTRDRTIGSVTALPEMTVAKTWTTFVDLTGDGRPDWVYREPGPGQTTRPLKIRVNITDSTGVKFAPETELFAVGNFDLDTVRESKLPLQLVTTVNHPTLPFVSLSTTWVRLMDFNGDGRLDIVDARHEGKKWIVYINTPPHLPQHVHHGEIPSDYETSESAPIVWMRTEVDVSNAQETLRTAFSDEDGEVVNENGYWQAANMWPGGASRLPLETVVSGATMNKFEGYMFDQQCAHATDKCAWESVGDFFLPSNTQNTRSSSRSVTVHRFQDVNADSFPDMLFSEFYGTFDVAHELKNPDGITGSDLYGVFRLNTTGVCQTFPAEGGWVEPTTDCPYHTFYPWQFGDSAEDPRFPDDLVAPIPHSWRGTDPYGNPVLIGPQLGEVWARGRQVGISGSSFGNVAFVLYNVAGAALGAQAVDSNAFADYIETLGNTGCNGIEEWSSSSYYGSGPVPRGAEFKCGIRDVNSDGLLDKLVATGDGAEFGVTASLGDGLSFTSTTMYLPEVLEASEAVWPTCDGVGRRHTAYLHDGEPLHNDDYYSLAETFLTDLDGDGLIDTGSRFGTGAGNQFDAPTTAPSLLASYATPRGDDSCNGGSYVTQMAVDINGDGRLEAAYIDDRTLKVSQLRSDGQDPGLLRHQRLVEVTDGYGVGTQYTYANAKYDNTTRHEVPFAEIVVAKTEVVGEPSDELVPQQEPTHFAYGDIQMRYSMTAGRFVPTGYAKQSTLRGRPVGNKIRGVGTVSYGLTPNDSYSTDFVSEVERDHLVGTTERERTFEGEFDLSDGAWDLLSSSANYTDPLRSETKYTYSSVAVPHHAPETMVQPFDRGGEQCPARFWPYGGTEGVSNSSLYTHQCVGRVRTSLVKEESRSGLFLEAGTSDDRTIVSRMTYEEFDARGRARRVRDHRDLQNENDDVCSIVEFAEPTTGSSFAAIHPDFDDEQEDGRLLGRMNQLLGVARKKEVTDCGTRVLSRVVTEFDELGSTGYDRAWPVRSKTYFEKENGSLTGDAEAIVSPTIAYNDYGQQTGSEMTWIEGVSDLSGAPVALGSSTSIEYDEFSLAPVEQTAIATDDETVLASSSEYDPVSLAPKKTTDENGTVTRVYYDGYHRPIKVTIANPDFNGNAEYIVSATEYLGDGSPSHADRTVRSKEFTAWKLASEYNPAATSPGVDERWVDTKFDTLGQVKYTETYLGGDAAYANKKLRSGAVKYDTLGRVVFAGTKPYVAGGTGFEGTVFGTTFRYPDYSTEPVCRWDDTQYQPTPNIVYSWKLALDEPVNGQRGYAPSAVPHYADGGIYGVIAPTCTLNSYEPNGVKTIQIHSTGLEGTRASMPLVASTKVFNGLGEMVEERAWDGSSNSVPAVQTSYAYDRFGRLVLRTNYRMPNAAAGQEPQGGLTEGYSYDGLGRVTKVEAPQVEPVYFGYDALGRTLTTRQADDQGQAQRFAQRYDGFGRQAETGRLLPDLTGFDGADSSHTQFTYRTASEHGAGQLASVARSGAPVVTTEYDLFGRTMRTITTQGSRTVEQEVVYDGVGRVGQMVNRVDDNGLVNEMTAFTYDSAGRVRKVRHGLGPVLDTVSNVTSLDLWGNPMVVARGNGSTESYSYNNNRFPRALSSVTTVMGGPIGLEDSRTSSQILDLLGRPTHQTTRLLDREGYTVISDVSHGNEYTYDVFGRIKTYALRTPTSGSPYTVKETYRYDALGSKAYVLNELNQAQSLAMVPHVDNTRRLCKTTVGNYSGATVPVPSPSDDECSFEYDLRGRLTSYVQPYTNVAIKLEHTHAGEVSAVEQDAQGGVRTEYTYSGTGGIASRKYGSSVYRVLGNTEERPGQAGATIVERHVAGGMSLRGTPTAGTKVYGTTLAAPATAIMSQGNAEASFRAYSPLGRRLASTGASNASSQGSIHQAPGEDVCGYQGSCPFELYRVGTSVYDPYLGRVIR